MGPRQPCHVACPAAVPPGDLIGSPLTPAAVWSCFETSASLCTTAQVADVHRVGCDIVRPPIERAAACQIEPGMMPIVGEDAVLHVAPMERKLHGWAAVVYRGYLPIVIEYDDRAVRVTTICPCTRKASNVPLCTPVVVCM
jgi:hypothetical protein